MGKRELVIQETLHARNRDQQNNKGSVNKFSPDVERPSLRIGRTSCCVSSHSC